MEQGSGFLSLKRIYMKPPSSDYIENNISPIVYTFSSCLDRKDDVYTLRGSPVARDRGTAQ